MSDEYNIILSNISRKFQQMILKDFGIKELRIHSLDDHIDMKALSMEDQANYCDYITHAICNHPQKIIVEHAKHLLKTLNLVKFLRVNSYMVANIAAVLLALKECEVKDELYEGYLAHCIT